jgi:hypothetical protein
MHWFRCGGILRKKREPFTGLEVSAKGERTTEYPTVFTEIHLTYRVHGPVSPKAMEDAAPLQRQVLFGFRNAGEDRKGHLRHRVCGSESGCASFRGYLYIGAAALFWESPPPGRAAFTGRVPGLKLGAIDPLILSQSRTTLSFLVLLPILLRRRGAPALRVPKQDLIRFLLIGVLGVAASNYLYYLSIQRTNVATAIILQYTAPVWVLL